MTDIWHFLSFCSEFVPWYFTKGGVRRKVHQEWLNSHHVTACTSGPRHYVSPGRCALNWGVCACAIFLFCFSNGLTEQEVTAYYFQLSTNVDCMNKKYILLISHISYLWGKNILVKLSGPAIDFLFLHLSCCSLTHFNWRFKWSWISCK